MPYIETDERPYWDILIKPLTDYFEKQGYRAGDLNYVVTKVVLGFLDEQENYTAFNEAIGALECAKLELYREKVAPYEDVKLLQNGTVY